MALNWNVFEFSINPHRVHNTKVSSCRQIKRQHKIWIIFLKGQKKRFSFRRHREIVYFSSSTLFQNKINGWRACLIYFGELKQFPIQLKLAVSTMTTHTKISQRNFILKIAKVWNANCDFCDSTCTSINSTKTTRSLQFIWIE